MDEEEELEFKDKLELRDYDDEIDWIMCCIGVVI
jgi:hypothetical protein